MAKLQMFISCISAICDNKCHKQTELRPKFVIFIG